jgi:uncharacterized protein YkwD
MRRLALLLACTFATTAQAQIPYGRGYPADDGDQRPGDPPAYGAPGYGAPGYDAPGYAPADGDRAPPGDVNAGSAGSPAHGGDAPPIRLTPPGYGDDRAAAGYGYGGASPAAPGDQRPDDHAPGDTAPGYGAPGYGGSTYGTPSYSAPSYGTPTYGTPTYGTPTYSGPSYGTQGYGTQGYGTQGTGAGPSYDDATPPSAAPASLGREMLAAHNAVRARVGEPPLHWSPRLAAAAQDWANRLIASGAFAHQPDDPYGQNLYAITGGAAAPAQVVAAWADEARSYDHSSNSCAGMCGHYTQIVWRATHSLGCGVATDPEREVWVCDYDPPGNVVGFRPY